MKQNYITPEMEIVEFEEEDVVTLSLLSEPESSAIVLPPMPLG